MCLWETKGRKTEKVCLFLSVWAPGREVELILSVLLCLGLRKLANGITYWWISPLISFVCIHLLFLFHNQYRYRLRLFIWLGYLVVLSCMKLAIYFADRTVCLVAFLLWGAVVLLCLENAQFVVLSRAGFSLPALFVTLPANPEAPRKGMKMWFWYYRRKGFSRSNHQVQTGHT